MGLRLLRGLACWLAFAGVALASEYHGQVTLGGVPVPGVTVTATHEGKKVAAVTDTQGVYSFPDLVDGSWTVDVEMTGFAPLKGEVTVAPNMPAGKWEMKMLSLEQMRAEAKPVKVDAPALIARTAPAAEKTAAAKTGEAKAAAAPASGAPPPPPAPDEARSDGLLINGSVNNAATSQFALGQAFGNTRSGGKALYNGSAGLVLDNSALDAKQFSLTGLDTAKPAYNRITGVATFGGPIKIPHLLLHGPNFFVGYQWTRSQTDNSVATLVPDAAERTGNLSELAGPIYNPTTGVAYAGNIVPVSSQAAALLNYFPLPNLSGDTRYNYQAATVNDNHSDSMQMRLDKSASKRDYLSGQFAFNSTRSSAGNIFGFEDRTAQLQFNTNVNWSHRFKQRLFMNLGYQFSRSRTRNTPYFANQTDVEGKAGITGVYDKPAYWGPPSLSFSSGIAGLSDAQAADNRNETNGVSANFTWNKLRHNVTFGGDLRRQEFNYLAEANPRGSFTFTGAATQGPASSAVVGGSDLADFLLGIPDASAIAYGNADKYLRQTVYDAFGDDDWRIRPDLTLHVGVRWEYGAPITELKGRLVNLDIAPGFTAVAPVLGSSPTGSLTGQSYPASLIRPDRIGVAPNLGASWRPFSGSSVVVKAGYQISHETSVYQGTASNMDQQAPLSTSLNVSNSAACPLTLAAGFKPCASVTADTFAVDPNFRVAYVQIWQLSVQRDLPRSLQMTVTYAGNKGTRGTQQFLPNTYPVGATNPCPSCPAGFTYRTSGGDSTREAGTVQIRRRLHNGLTATAQYTFSKSLDDDSIIGGSGSGIAQNWLNLRGERALSSFDQRHLLTVHLQYTTGMGIGGRTLMSGWKGAVYKDWSFVSDITVGSGLPETPSYLEAVSGTGFTNIVRPNVTGASIYAKPAGLFLNPAAFAAPALGQWGDARRDSITGPNQFSLNASMARTFRLHDRYSLDARLDSTNALNHVAFTGWVTTLNSSQFGLPTAAGAPRSVQATMRLRF